MNKVKQSPKPSIRNRKRVASASLRGYRYQLLYTVRRSLELDADTSLVIEGNEDIDRIPLSSADANFVEEQIKLRSAALAWSSVTNVLLSFTEAFMHHHQCGRKFVGILRTNAEIAQGPDCAIRRWVEGKRPNHDRILRELRRLPKGVDDTNLRRAVAYVSDGNHIRALLASIEWATSAPTPDAIEENLRHSIAATIPAVSPDVALRTLTSEILRRATVDDVAGRILTKLDVDIILNNLVLDKVASDFTEEEATAAIALVPALSGQSAATVIVLASRPEQLKRRVDDACAAHEVLGEPADRGAAIAAQIGSLDFVAYASVIVGGPRRYLVCLRDALRQARHRWQIETLLVPRVATHATVALQRMLPGVQLLNRDSDLLIIGEILAASLLARVNGSEDGNRILRLVGHKLRWVHRIDTAEYFTAATPLLPSPSS